MLIGAQHIITFDHRVINFRGSCSYLLAHDFKDDNFSVIVEYGSQDKHEQPTLLVLLEKDTIKIDLSDDVQFII
jgi:von Willebrand factor type D domain